MDEKTKKILQAIISNITDIVFILGENREIKFISRNINRNFGWTKDELTDGITNWDKLHPDDQEDFNKAFNNLVQTPGATITRDYRFLSKYEGYRYIKGTATNLIHDENVKGILFNFQDVTSTLHEERKIQYLSYHDSLTGLYNRAFFMDEIKRIDKEDELPISIIIGDVNGLKLVNDGFGHIKGDELLFKIGQVLKSSCRDEDTVCRIGGDEFCILLPKTSNIRAENICQRIHKTCLEQNVDDTISLSISLGCRTKTNISESIIGILKSAEGSMYRHKLLDSKCAHGNLITSIKTTLHEKSHETQEHAERLVQLCQSVGKELELAEEQLRDLELAAMLHDIGKIGVDQRILNKNGSLTDEEWHEVKNHPGIGYRIALASPDLLHIADYILYHHERWDGKGYPQGLEGESIPLLSRIIAVVDSFDAMTNDRPYKKAKPKDCAIKEIKENAGIQFDPKIAEVFLSCLKKNFNNNKRRIKK